MGRGRGRVRACSIGLGKTSFAVPAYWKSPAGFDTTGGRVQAAGTTYGRHGRRSVRCFWVLARKGPRMAKWHDALIVVGLLALVGCQAQKPVAMVDPLPAPNFGGPTLASPVLAAPEPPPVTKVEPAAKPTPKVAVAQAAPAPVVPLPSHAGVPR